MAFTTPGTATAGEVLTAAFWNTNVRDNSNFLYSPPMVRIVRTTNLTSYVSQAAIQYETEVFDTDSMVNLATDATKITINTAGVYWVFFRARPSGTATITRTVLNLLLNGSSIASQDLVQISTTTSGVGNLSVMLPLSVGDEITSAADMIGGSAYTIPGNATENVQRATLQLTWVGNT
jgi:hypothetical protein